MQQVQLDNITNVDNNDPAHIVRRSLLWIQADTDMTPCCHTDHHSDKEVNT